MREIMDTTRPGTVGAAPATETVPQEDHPMPKGTANKPVCRADGCTSSSYGQHYCRSHLVKWQRHGDPLGNAHRRCAVDGCEHVGRVFLGMCQAHYRRSVLGKVVDGPIARHPGGSVHAHSGYRRLTAFAHPLATPSGVYEHRVVLYDIIGPGYHPCHWCGSQVTWDIRDTGAAGALTVDHLDWDRANNDPSNLVASCWPCNANRREYAEQRLRLA